MPFSTEPWLWEKEYCGWGWSLFPPWDFLSFLPTNWQQNVLQSILGPKLWQKTKQKLAGGSWHPFETYAQVKLDHFPSDRGENQKYLKPPSRVVKNACQIGSFSQNQRETTKALNIYHLGSGWQKLPKKIHPRKLTWNIKITHLKRKIIFHPPPYLGCKQAVAFTLLGEINKRLKNTQLNSTLAL